MIFLFHNPMDATGLKRAFEQDVDFVSEVHLDKTMVVWIQLRAK